MDTWVVVGAWIFAGLFAAVLLGFAAYELSWKSRRLLSDQAKLTAVSAQVSAVASDLQRAGARASQLHSH